MRVLVTGANGQLGRELLDRAGDREVVGRTSAQLDVTDADAVRRTLGEVAPDVVVNAAAMTAVDDCETAGDRAMQVNATAVGHLAAAADAADATLVHVSTDYVFGADDLHGTPVAEARPDGWREDDPTSPLSVYGRSKLAGEEAARAQGGERVHVVRTAWVASAHGGGFVRTMLRLADEGRDIAVVDDQHGSPTVTWDLVDRIWRIVDHGLATGEHGTWHATNSGACSWYDLAAATFELAGVSPSLGRQPSSALDRPAPRPPWSVLADTRGDALGWPSPPHWREGLTELLRRLGRLASPTG